MKILLLGIALILSACGGGGDYPPPVVEGPVVRPLEPSPGYPNIRVEEPYVLKGK